LVYNDILNETEINRNDVYRFFMDDFMNLLYLTNFLQIQIQQQKQQVPHNPHVESVNYEPFSDKIGSSNVSRFHYEIRRNYNSKKYINFREYCKILKTNKSEFEELFKDIQYVPRDDEEKKNWIGFFGFSRISCKIRSILFDFLLFHLIDT
jgi:hypothetical protein